MTLNDVMGQLTSVLVEWNGFLKDPQYIRNNELVTWSNSHVTMLPENITKAETLKLSQQRQFTFRISLDDSVLQLTYRFFDGAVKEARLAYYEVGLSDSDTELGDVHPPTELDFDQPARWVRFDYRDSGLERVLHTDSHLHVSGLPGTRFAVAGLLTPKQFIEFIVAHFYPDIYKRFRLEEGIEFNDLIDSVMASPSNVVANLLTCISA